MKRFIRYLYEYEQGKRLRNVGFVKVEQKDEDCTLSIHGKGLHMKGERKLDLYLFFDEDGGCAGIWQGTVDNVSPAINYRLFYTKEDVIVPENFQKINGIILESETGRKYAAVWNDTAIDVGRMQVLKPDDVQKEERPLENAAPEEKMPAEHALPQEKPQEKELAQDGGMSGQEGPAQDGESAGQENADKSVELLSSGMRMPEESASGEMSVQEESEQDGSNVQSMEQGQDPMPDSNSVHQTDSMTASDPAQSVDSIGGNAMHAGVPVEDVPVREEPIEPSAEESSAQGAVREDLSQGEAVRGRVSAERGTVPAENRGMFPRSDTDVGFSQEMTVEPIENICGDTAEPMPKEHLRCTKIQRNDMARLPRCEWKWANNSFLLHGYYNYHHLAIIDDGERYRLGVPGIYHPQEAKAASTFGFTEFIPHKDTDMDLTDDEKSGQEQFGYWCRPIKRMLRTQ